MVLFYDTIKNTVYGTSGDIDDKKMIDMFMNGYIIHLSESFEWLPTKATSKSHGLDCKAKIQDEEIVIITEDGKKEKQRITHKELYTFKNTYYRFSLGIRLLTPDYLRPELKPRSSLTPKKGLLYATSGIIDNDYFEPLLLGTLAIRNDKLEHGERVAQLLYYGNYQKYLEEKNGIIIQIVDPDLYNALPMIMEKYGLKTDRDGGYGHTGSK